MDQNVVSENLDEIPPEKWPIWMNGDFFKSFIKNEVNSPRGKSFKINISSVKHAVPMGENYVSVLYRVVIEVTESNKRNRRFYFIVKYLQVEHDFMRDMNMIGKEVIMYNDLIPKIENEFKSIDEDFQIAPKCYYAVTKPDNLVFDDLTSIGYSVQSRHVGLDLDHAYVFLIKLAKYHAASAVYQEKNGPYTDLFHCNPKMYYNSFAEEHRKITFPLFIKTIKGSPLLQKYAEIFVSIFMFTY